MDRDEESAALYVVALTSDADDEGILEGADTVRLAPGLYLVRTSAPQSRLYHAVKREAKPSELFVGRLDGDPKFKGMSEGALKWLRRR
ncbi:hypothetical protein [Methyloligella solikamskensis]|uniref:Uncharacterized protein n=1 Tax=Methyloligella solikamskensis TaxID=1177756 RepID=A0ABW3JB22_9HYPH